MVKRIIYLIIGFCSLHFSSFAQESDSVIIRRIYSIALSEGKAYGWLDTLCHSIGGRLSGSPEAAKAVKWAEKTMINAGAENVFLQEVMVPHWVRGEKEKAEIISTNKSAVEVTVCALGGSIGTNGLPLNAEVIEIKNFDEMKQLGKEKIQGKFVFFNRPMDPTMVNTFEAYGGAVEQRWAAALRAAPYGAIGTITRSMTPDIDDYPHTGSMAYNDTIKKIPAVAISTLGAEKLSAMLKQNPSLTFKLTLSCKALPDTLSHNVIGEITGSKNPEKIILVGGHLDSWDNGDGAHDDGAGVVQSMEVINIFKQLGITTRHTIRAVAFMNEENGVRGGKKYAELAKENGEQHIAAIESDAGGFTPRGFFMEGDSVKKEKIKSWKKLFEPYNVHSWNHEGSGADIHPLKEQGAFLLGLSPDSQRYFDIHHTPNDLFKHVSRRELELGAATMAALIYLIDKYGL